jgi:hypothetical protein
MGSGAMRQLWRKVDESLYAAVIGGRGGLRYHLIVERLPGGDGWDWTVWRPGDPPEAARHGVAPSTVRAMRAAEAAVRSWDNSTSP